MDKITHQVRRERWAKIMNECLASGMNKTAWCRANGISDKSFFYWQKILRNEAYISDRIPDTALPTVRDTSLPSKQSVDFVELKIPDQPLVSTPNFRPDIIVRKGSFSLEISNTVSAELLDRIGGLLHAE